MKRICIFITLFLYVVCTVNSQELSNAEKTPLSDALIKDYLEKTQGFATIYSGKEQAKYLHYIKGDPYFIDENYKTGSLSYEGIIYPEVSLRLDLCQNELLIHSPDKRFNIILDPKKVDYAYLHGYKIIYHTKSGNTIPLESGYYILLSTGKYETWRQSTCIIKETITDNIVREFIKKDKYYFIKDDRPYLVKGTNSVVKLFPAIKKELKQSIKRNKHSFKHDPEGFLVEISKQIEILE